MSQTAVATIQDPGIVGQLADFQSAADAVVDSAFSEEAANQIDFGIFVVEGAADDGAKLPAAPADRLKGLVVQTHEYARGVEIDNVTLKLLPKATFSILTRGRMFVLSTGAVAKTDAVHVQMVAEAGHDVGTLRTDASIGKTLNISALARWLTAASGAGQICKLEVDMANIELATAD